MFIKLLTPVILKAYEIYSHLFKHKNYEIIYRSLTYETDPDSEQYFISSDFWQNESQYWSYYNTSHYVDITNKNISNDPVPSNVKNCMICTKYYYNNKVYKYVTRGISQCWPPEDSSTGIFLPIVRASLINQECDTARDVTEKIKRYAGPKSNFYGKAILIQDIFSYDEETMKKEYPYLVISDAMANTKAFKTDHSVDLVAK
jgi:hypothetical protein